MQACNSFLCFVLQLSTRLCVLEGKASDQTPSLSSWKVVATCYYAFFVFEVAPGYTYRNTSPQWCWVFPFSLPQTSMSVRNCPAYAREDGASTRLVVSTVNVQEALPSTWTPEFVKVLSTHMHKWTNRWPIRLQLWPWDISLGRKLSPAVEMFFQWHMERERERKKHWEQKGKENIGPCCPIDNTAAQ